MGLRPTLLTIALITSTSSCALDDRGFVRVRHYETPTSHSVTLHAWGLHMITMGPDAGVAFGRSERTYHFRAPVRDGGAAAGVPVEVPSAAASASAPKLRVLGKPFAYSRRTDGLGADVNPHRVGLWAGLDFRHGVLVPREFNGFIYLSGQHDVPESWRIHIDEEHP